MKVEKVLTITRKERKEMIRVRKKLTKELADFFGMSVKELVKDRGLYEFNFDTWLAIGVNDKKWGSEQFTEIYKYLKSHVFNYSDYKETMIGYLIRNLGDRHYERRGIFNSKILLRVESTIIKINKK